MSKQGKILKSSLAFDPVDLNELIDPRIGELALDESDNKLKQYDGSAWKPVGSGAGGGAGGINYITNPDAESDTSGWTADSPLTWTRTTSDPLRGEASFLLSKPASSALNSEVESAFVIDVADRAQVLTVAFDYKVLTGGGAPIAGLKVIIRDEDASADIAPSVQRLDGSGKFIATFQTSAASTNYTFKLLVDSSNATAWTVQFDNIQVGPSLAAGGDSVISFRATNSGTQTGINTNDSDVKLTFNTVLSSTGSFTNNEFTVPEDGDYSFSAVAQVGGTNQVSPSGRYFFRLRVNGSSANYYRGEYYVASTAQQTGMNDSWFIPGLKAGDVVALYFYGIPNNSSNTLSVSDATFGGFKVPTSGSSSIAGGRVIAFRARNNSGSSITANTTDIPFTNTLYDTTASWNGSVYTVPENGFYHIDASIRVDSATSAQILVYVNGSSAASFLFPSNLIHSLSTDLQLNAGDQVSIRFAASTTLTSDANLHRLNIHKIQSPQSLMGGPVVAFYGTNTAGTAINNSGTAMPYVAQKDTHNAWTGTRYNVPQPGFYTISTTVRTQNINQTIAQGVAAIVTVDGTNIIADRDRGAGAGANQMCSGTFTMWVDEYVEFKPYSDVSGNLNTGAGNNHVSICKVG